MVQNFVCWKLSKHSIHVYVAVSCFMCCQHAGVGRRLNIRMTSRQPHEQTYRFTFLCARAKRKRGETFFF